jgi:hypothetical protein
MQGIKFVSKEEIERKKAAKAAEVSKTLENLQRQVEIKRSKVEAKRELGHDTWINPSLSKRIDNGSSNNNIATSDRASAGLSWMVAPPSREKKNPSEEQRSGERDNDNTHDEIEAEVKAGLRDPVSKLPYGLFQPGKKNERDADVKGVEGMLEREKHLAEQHRGSGSSWERKQLADQVKNQSRNATEWVSKGSRYGNLHADL